MGVKRLKNQGSSKTDWQARERLGLRAERSLADKKRDNLQVV